MGGQLGRVRRRAGHGLIARLDELAARPGRQLIHSEGWELGERERRATGLVPERAWQIAVGPGGRCTALLIARLAGPVVAKFEKYCVPPRFPSGSDRRSRGPPAEFKLPPPRDSDVHHFAAYKHQADQVLAASARLTDAQKIVAELVNDKLMVVSTSFPRSGMCGLLRGSSVPEPTSSSSSTCTGTRM